MGGMLGGGILGTDSGGSAASTAIEVATDKGNCVVATTENISLSDPSTWTVANTIDGVSLVSNADAGLDYILVKHQTDSTENGIYTWNGTGNAITRSHNANESADFRQGAVVHVDAGTVNGDSIWHLANIGKGLVLGTTELFFRMIAADRETSNIIYVGGQHATDTKSSGEIYSHHVPYATVQSAMTAATSGDILLVRDGDYTGEGTITNTAGVDVVLDYGASVTETGLSIIDREFDPSGNLTLGGNLEVEGNVGFYNTTPVAQQTGVAVSAAGIHAALVNLGLITA